METLHSLKHKLNQIGIAGNRDNIGTVGNSVRAIEYGDANNHRTVLSIDKKTAFALGDAASKGVGHLVYTLPAGNIIINNAYMVMLTTNAEHDGEVIEAGVGTSIATGAVSVLSGTAGFENILTGQAGTVGLVTQGMDVSDSTSGIGGLLIPAANAHTIYFNIAGAWANTAGLALNADISGSLVINWTFMV